MKGGKRRLKGNLTKGGLLQWPHPCQGHVVARLEHVRVALGPFWCPGVKAVPEAHTGGAPGSRCPQLRCVIRWYKQKDRISLEFCRKKKIKKNNLKNHLYQKERKSRDVLFLQLLAQVLGTRVLSGSAAPEQQHCAGEPQWSGKEPGVQRARNTWGKKSFMNSFSCNIAEIKLFLTISRDL